MSHKNPLVIIGKKRFTKLKTKRLRNNTSKNVSKDIKTFCTNTLTCYIKGHETLKQMDPSAKYCHLTIIRRSTIGFPVQIINY